MNTHQIIRLPVDFTAFNFTPFMINLSLSLSLALSLMLTPTPAAAQVLVTDLAPNAPAQHVVKKGDTLWDISGLFLKSPWKWPALWGMNKDMVKNPHLIYPGQILVLTKDGNRVRLGFADGKGGVSFDPNGKLLPGQLPNGDFKLSPTARSEPLTLNPITAISLKDAQQFLVQPLVLDVETLAGSGYVLSTPESRVYAAKGDTLYARGLAADNQEPRFQIYRPSRPLKDPKTGKTVAFEAYFVGTAEIVKNGDPATLKILTSKEEIEKNDRLLPMQREPSLNFAPRAPDKPIDTYVLSSYNGVQHAGNNMVVTLAAGRKDGLELGHVLTAWRLGDTVRDDQAEVKEGFGKFMREKVRVKLPDEKQGDLIVFRVFENISYALILRANQAVQLGDRVTQPD